MSPWNQRPAIEGFSIEEEIGRGASAVVYRARMRDGRDVALKVLKASLDPQQLESLRKLAAAVRSSAEESGAVSGHSAQSEKMRRFLKADRDQKNFDREARMYAALRGKGFVECLDAGIDERGQPFFALELMAGGSLSDRLRRLSAGRMAIDELLQLGVVLARALGHAHELGVVHRDLKPGNILFTATGEARIGDLGLAKHYDRSVPGASQSQSVTKEGDFRGTIAYMAPEQANPVGGIGPEADVFSLGVLLYECLTGELPFRGRTAIEILAQAAQGFYTPPRKLRPETPKFVAEVIERCLRPEATARFRNGAEVSAALARVAPLASPLELGGEVSGVQLVPGRRRIVALGFANGLLLLVLVLVAIVIRHRPETPATPRATTPPASPLTVYLDAPPEGATLPPGRISVEGRLSMDADCDLSVNGVAVVSSHGRFRAVVRVEEGTRTIVVSGNRGPLKVVPLERHVSVLRGADIPEWFRSLLESERPPVPLPDGVEFTAERGVYRNRMDGSSLVYVPAGVFSMGSNEGPPEERPVHEVGLSAYFIGKYAVTNEQFERFVRKGQYRTHSEREKAKSRGVEIDQEALIGRPVARTWRDPLGEGRVPPGDFPVVEVDWEDAMAYAKWAGLTLPTEAQWERAAAWDARVKRARKYAWGDLPFEKSFPDLVSRISRGWGTWPVGGLGVPESPCGAVDMTSGVCEWCRDGADQDDENRIPRYPAETVTDPFTGSPRSQSRLQRGGAEVPCAERSRLVSRTFYYPHVGFRLVLNP